MIDNKAPVLKRLVLPSLIDIGPGAQSFRVEIEADDGEGGSGIAWADVWIDRSLQHTDGYSAWFSFNRFQGADSFGDATPNIASAVYTVGERTPVGAYTVNRVSITDVAGNVAQYETAQLKALGFATTFSVSGRPADVSPPVLTKLTLPPSVDLSGNVTSIPVLAQAIDGAGGSGVRTVSIYFDKPLSGEYSGNFFYLFANSTTRIEDGVPQSLSSSQQLSPTTAPGNYRILYVAVTDYAGNTRNVHVDELTALGASLDITVTGTAADTSAPELLDLWLPRTVSRASGVDSAFAVAARDPGAGSGVASAYALFERELALSSGPWRILSIGDYAQGDSFKDATPEFGFDRFRLVDTAAPGTYKLESLRLIDRAGNFTTYTAAELEQRGINTVMTVVDGAASAWATPSVADGKLLLSLSSSDWASSGLDAYTVTLAYDPAQAKLVDARVLGAPGARVAASHEQPGRLTVSGSGDLPADAVLQLELRPLAGTAPFSFAIESFRVNGIAQILGAGNIETLRFGSAQADVLQVASHRGMNSGLVAGLEGLDEAVFTGAAAAYTVGKSGSGFVVLHQDGTRVVLDGVERLRFDDRQLALDIDGVAGQAYRLYQAAFDRKPDEAGVGYWMRRMDDGASLESVARAFLHSAEFERQYGVEPGNEAFLDALYTNVLHRAPDPDGYAYWLNALRANFERAELLVLFSESAENVAQVIGSIENGFAYLG